MTVRVCVCIHIVFFQTFDYQILLISYERIVCLLTILFVSTALPSTVVCPTLSDPHNGDIVITTTTVGSSVSYTCRRGYRLDGQTVRECQSNGQWTGSDPVCSCEFIFV